MLRFSNGQPAGQLVVTSGIDATGMDVDPLVQRHLAGDWGDVTEEDRLQNDESLLGEGMILSAYKIDSMVVWIITDPSREVTTVLLPDEN